MIVDNSVLLELLRRLPAELAPLAHVAFNYAWSWSSDDQTLFSDIDPELWVACNRNPVRLLSDTSRLEQARASDTPARAVAALARLEAELAAPTISVGEAHAERPIAYLCAEFGIHPSLPVYAGGLGVLAGDFLKEASDRRLPLVGVGLYYHRGYFHQRLDLTGLQHEYWISLHHERMPMRLVRQDDGSPLTVSVELRGRNTIFQIWRVDVGRVPLFLLDSDVPANTQLERFVTGQLYVADRDVRLMQYAALGIGGVRALAALGITTSIVHMNEGHTAFAALELARGKRGSCTSLNQAVSEVRSKIVFTTHTPVVAGNETYAPAQLQQVLPGLAADLGASDEELLALGRAPTALQTAPFGMTELGLHASRSTNAVSKRHGEIARNMWHGIYPLEKRKEVPISHVTNGVHIGTWMAAPMRRLLRRFLGDDWESAAQDPARWAKVHEIPDAELWQVRHQLRAAMIDVLHVRSVADRLDRGEPLEYVEAAAGSFNANELTVGFARRVATYKRLHLLSQNPERALRLLGGDRPIQVVIAGKAHPNDEEAKRGVQTIFMIKRATNVGTSVVFLEDYDLATAHSIVSGCDVWINLPRPPNEASGTSGMKNMLNGGLQLSVLDGWWCEGYADDLGWAIDSPSGLDPYAQDRADAHQLYDLLEQQIVPAFYERDERGLPQRWLHRIKNSLASLGPRFNSSRMVSEYTSDIYSARV